MDRGKAFAVQIVFELTGKQVLLADKALGGVWTVPDLGHVVRQAPLATDARALADVALRRTRHGEGWKEVSENRGREQ